MTQNKKWFSPYIFESRRLSTNTVKVADLLMGNNKPVRVQSMANTSTSNVDASVNQAIEIIKAGGELVRFTVINKQDAESLRLIKEELVRRNYHTPIVADIHFNAKLADIVAQYVDKVRINPGNYLERRATFDEVNFTDEEYNAELEKLDIRLSNFLNICKQNNTAIRIGTNHGSLSDRIMTRYGDTSDGMVEATMEFLRICKKEKFDNVVVSLKSSNTRVMVQAYRLLALQMLNEQMSYNIHLGVTEAGNGEDGIIKSAAGIGTLMNDGLGDTIRVSLTEHPANEIPVAQALAKHFETLNKVKVNYNQQPEYNPYSFTQRQTHNVLNKTVPIVVADLSHANKINQQTLEQLDFKFDTEIKKGQLSPDYIYLGEHTTTFKLPQTTNLITDSKVWNANSKEFPLFSFNEYMNTTSKSEIQNWVTIEYSQLTNEAIEQIKNDTTLVLVATSSHDNPTAEIRMLINKLMLNNCKQPVIIKHSYNEAKLSDFQIKSSADNAIFFIDGLAQGLWISNSATQNLSELTTTAFTILQATRSRTTKTEYIACPGCGRTLFELEKTLAEVKKHTKHLSNYKIAVMGCLVNGPGEMADADYGYVGAGTGKVALYRGKEVVKRNISDKDAVQELLNLIAQDEAEKS